MFKKKMNTVVLWAVTFALMLSFYTGCKKTSYKRYRIGILSYVEIHAPVIEGFKEGMKQLGYVEGKDVEYIYNGVLKNDEKIIDTEIRELLSQDIDLLLPIGNEAALMAKNDVGITDTPVLFSACNEIIDAGLVAGMTRPAGNITGIINVDPTPKVLEGLKRIIPDIKKVYLPYNPDEKISVASVTGAVQIALEMGIEIVSQEVHSVEETTAVIENLPEDIDAILRIPSPTLDPRNNELSQAAIKRGLPIAARLPLDKDVLLTFASDLNELGWQTARLAHLIRQGFKPSDIPIETSEIYLTINLKTAEKIGVNIPDIMLMEAKIIIR